MCSNIALRFLCIFIHVHAVQKLLKLITSIHVDIFRLVQHARNVAQFSVFCLAISNMALRHVALQEPQVALHERHVALYLLRRSHAL